MHRDAPGVGAGGGATGGGRVSEKSRNLSELITMCILPEEEERSSLNEGREGLHHRKKGRQILILRIHTLDHGEH